MRLLGPNGDPAADACGIQKRAEPLANFSTRVPARHIQHARLVLLDEGSGGADALDLTHTLRGFLCTYWCCCGTARASGTRKIFLQVGRTSISRREERRRHRRPAVFSWRKGTPSTSLTPRFWIALDEMDLMWIPVIRAWRLNERHYGALQGLNKAETAAKYGEQQVKTWRRSYDIQPPALEESDPRYPGRDPRYKNLTKDQLPRTECLKDTVKRFLPCWHDVIAPAVISGKRVLITAHGNSLRALVKYLDNVGEKEIVELNIPTGMPLVYELDANLKPLKSYYLGDPERVKAAMEAVASQGKIRG